MSITVIEVMQCHAQWGEEQRQQYPGVVFGGHISDEVEGVDSRLCSVVLVLRVAFFILFFRLLFLREHIFIMVLVLIVQQQCLKRCQSGQQCLQFSGSIFVAASASIRHSPHSPLRNFLHLRYPHRHLPGALHIRYFLISVIVFFDVVLSATDDDIKAAAADAAFAPFLARFIAAQDMPPPPPPLRI